MFFNAKKKRYLTVKHDGSTLYEGYWADTPFAEEIIIKKSIEFFNDNEPCAIHRGAVHMRLLAELEGLFSTPDFQDLFCLYTNFPKDCETEFSEK
ncbi:hypothetical protein [Butyrivibrio sp. VCD2006]|uniref:hypothetical protein n=1 Tax=Butyrivibrio sp. VCD2006 TaxID=1280664 RepID=UPI00041D7FDF|nr:hypothetical protein [Butyrivibrio sp. VCD2006]